MQLRTINDSFSIIIKTEGEMRELNFQKKSRELITNMLFRIFLVIVNYLACTLI